MKSYETTLILDPQMQEEGWEKSIEKYAAIITRQGTIKRTDRWGLRRMSYEIQKRTQGYYVQFVHESQPGVPRELERQCILDESCLRYMTIVADNPRYLEEMDKRAAARESATPPPAVAGESTASEKPDTNPAPKPAETAAPAEPAKADTPVSPAEGEAGMESPG